MLGAVDGARPLPASLEVLIKVDDPAVDGRSETAAVGSDSWESELVGRFGYNAWTKPMISSGLSIKNLVEASSSCSVVGGKGASLLVVGGSKESKMAMTPSRISGFTRAWPFLENIVSICRVREVACKLTIGE